MVCSQVNLNTNYSNYNSGRFGTLTTEQKAYQGRYEGVPSTLPQVAFIPTEEQMKAAEAYLANAKIGGSENIFAPKRTTTQTQDARGAAWAGYSTPANNGTGQLIPVVSGRETEIEGCTWEPYLA